METNPAKLTLHMAASLDGFIARKDGDLSWMECSWSEYAAGESGDDAGELLAAIGCYIMGSKTYELALELGWPYGDTPVIVVTRRPLTSARKTVEFFSGELEELARSAKARYENVWLVGGPALCKAFLRLGLVDEICLTVIPILLGAGVPFFGDSCAEWKLRLQKVSAFKNGMVDLWYTILVE